MSKSPCCGGNVDDFGNVFENAKRALLYVNIANIIDGHMKENKKLQARIAELEQAQRWISVEERLPESGSRVLVSMADVIDGRTVKIAHFYGEPKGSWFIMDFGVVTHWMPLPAPPEEVENGNA